MPSARTDRWRSIAGIGQTRHAVFPARQHVTSPTIGKECEFYWLPGPPNRGSRVNSNDNLTETMLTCHLMILLGVEGDSPDTSSSVSMIPTINHFDDLKQAPIALAACYAASWLLSPACFRVWQTTAYRTHQRMVRRRMVHSMRSSISQV